jgi:hypothetical protein
LEIRRKESEDKRNSKLDGERDKDSEDKTHMIVKL